MKLTKWRWGIEELVDVAFFCFFSDYTQIIMYGHRCESLVSGVKLKWGG